MMTLGTLATWLKLPALVATGTGALYGVLISVGFSITTPGQSQAMLEQDLNKRMMTIDSTLAYHSSLLENLTRHQCIESSRQELMLSGLISECSRLGVDVE